jgi:hypothetical protein
MHGALRPAAATAAAALLLSLGGCGGPDPSSSTAEHETDHDADVGGSAAADVSTCHDEASPAPTPYPKGFAPGFPFPPGTIVFDVEDRGKFGIIATGISTSDLKDVLHFMNTTVVGKGFKTTEGETEDHDAEANWAGNGYRGRWAIRDSANCSGETAVQVLSAPK